MGGFFDNLKDGVNDFIFSLTTNDRYATSRSPYNANNLNSGQNTYRRTNSNANFISNSNNASNVSLDRSNQNVGYRPGLKSKATNDGEIPLNDYGNAAPISEIWERLDHFFGEEYPELVEFICEPATAADLNELENDINVSLPLDVRESYQIHDGQERGGRPSGVIFGLTLLDLESIAEEYSVWQTAARKIDYERKLYVERLNAYKHQMAQLNAASSSDGNKNSKLAHQKKIQPPVPRIDFVAHQRSVPEGAIQPVYVHSGWVPLVKDFAGNNIAVDLAPGPKGKWGQIICFGQDFDTKFVIANSWSEFLESVAADYEKGNFIVDEVEEELWYAENGRPLNYLDVLKKKFLAPLRAHQQRKPRIVSGPSNSSTPRLSSTSQFPAARLGENATGSSSTTNVVLPKETLIVPEKEEAKEGASTTTTKESKDENDTAKTESSEEIKPKTQTEKKEPVKTETEKVAEKAELTFDDNESILTNEDKDDDEATEDKPLKDNNKLELKDVDF